MKKWLIGLTITLSTVSCATNQQNGKLNDIEARIQVLELKQSEILKELQTMEQRLTQIRKEFQNSKFPPATYTRSSHNWKTEFPIWKILSKKTETTR